MNTILLQPTDVLFFRDGRPMTGASAGHTAAWPLPDITNHALHAALHRAEFEGVHAHGHVQRQNNRARTDARKFGSLLTAGPFPVRVDLDGQVTWFFPRPKDATVAGSVTVTLIPANRPHSGAAGDRWTGSSLPDPLTYAIVSTQPPSKESGGEAWIGEAAYQAYLNGQETTNAQQYVRDTDIADQEAQLGIAIDPETQTTGHGAAAGKIYTAHYLRVRDRWRLGVLAEAMDKFNGDPGKKRDLIPELICEHGQIVVGGQQRICTAERVACGGQHLPLPPGLARAADFHKLPNGKFAVKWVLLSPAVWPEFPEGDLLRGAKRNPHPGGWLPNWVCPTTGTVLLRVVDEAERRRRRSLDYGGNGYDGNQNAKPINARIVAALVPKPLVVTGWALPTGDDPADNGGAKSTHLAVPAGAVYYFEAGIGSEAEALASALNWHGDTAGTAIKNRRSTLLGEKGYGLGVCGTWKEQG